VYRVFKIAANSITVFFMWFTLKIDYVYYIIGPIYITGNNYEISQLLGLSGL